MYCINIHYKNTCLELRSKFAFHEESRIKLMERLVSEKIVSECVILCTCNRTEVYYHGQTDSKEKIIPLLSDAAGTDEELLSKHILYFEGDKAIYHLFKVACGIDSAVIGEDEILGQTKQAYFLSHSNRFAAYYLNRIFQSAITCAKKIKTTTMLSKTSVSTATLAASQAAKWKNKVNVLVIGASGKIGSCVLKNLVSYRNVKVRAAFRKHCLPIQDTVETVPYEKRYEYITEADCIISATSSPHYTITLYDLKKYIDDGKSRLFIDLAVPSDIDPSVRKLDNLQLINIDYFGELAKVNNEIKLSCLDEAEEMIQAEMDELKKILIFHDFLPELDDIKSRLQSRTLEELIYQMKAKSDSRSFGKFLDILKSVAREE